MNLRLTICILISLFMAILILVSTQKIYFADSQDRTAWIDCEEEAEQEESKNSLEKTVYLVKSYNHLYFKISITQVPAFDFLNHTAKMQYTEVVLPPPKLG